MRVQLIRMKYCLQLIQLAIKCSRHGVREPERYKDSGCLMELCSCVSSLLEGGTAYSSFIYNDSCSLIAWAFRGAHISPYSVVPTLVVIQHNFEPFQVQC